MAQFLVDVDLYAREAEKLLADALTGISHNIVQVEQVGEVADGCNGYPWKRIHYTNERLLARLPLGAPVYGETNGD